MHDFPNNDVSHEPERVRDQNPCKNHNERTPCGREGKKRLEDIQLFRIALHHHLQCESSGCESIWSSLRTHNIQAYGGIVVVNAVQFAT